MKSINFMGWEIKESSEEQFLMANSPSFLHPN